ncbi:MAG: hypothetical protein HC812_19100 [Leptolyngbya sp. RL_3_1]|nr:hypothetical protein [Leptolyngbya sp. RL_3_1]
MQRLKSLPSADQQQLRWKWLREEWFGNQPRSTQANRQGIRVNFQCLQPATARRLHLAGALVKVCYSPQRAGTAGGEQGVRGFLAAYDQSTGKEVWRFWTIPAPGEPGRMPFWRGDGPGRPLEFGRAVGALTRGLLSVPREQALKRLIESHRLEERAARNLMDELRGTGLETGGPHRIRQRINSSSLISWIAC